MATPCEQIAASMGALFECSQINRYTRIRTPFLYPDGDVIDLYWDEQDGNITITDLGGSLGWLSMQTASPKRLPNKDGSFKIYVRIMALSNIGVC